MKTQNSTAEMHEKVRINRQHSNDVVPAKYFYCWCFYGTVLSCHHMPTLSITVPTHIIKDIQGKNIVIIIEFFLNTACTIRKGIVNVIYAMEKTQPKGVRVCVHVVGKQHCQIRGKGKKKHT